MLISRNLILQGFLKSGSKSCKPEVTFAIHHVGAKYEIYEQIGKIVAEGKTAIVISSDMTELIGLCDRVYVMNEGRMVGELSGEQITQENIMRCIISNAVRGEAE